MKKEIIYLLLFGLLLGWVLGWYTARLKAFQCATNARLTELESRMLPVEQDHNRRKRIRACVSTVIDFIRGFLG